MLDDEMTSGATSETLYFNDGQTYYWRVAAYYADETNSGFSSYNYFTISATPIISDYKYCEYPAGMNVGIAILGNNFGDVQGDGSVQFYCGDPKVSTYVVATIISGGWSNTEIDCYIPMHTSSGPVKVTNDQGLINNLGNTSNYDVSWGYLGGKWPSTSTTYCINLSNYKGGSTSPTNLQALNNLIIAGATTWNSGNTDALFNFNNDQTSSYYIGFDVVPAGETAFTYTYRLNGIIKTIYTKVDQTLNWDPQTPNNYDLQTTATHEFGHWLGLTDLFGTDDNEDQKVMYYKYVGPRRSLSQYDINGIQSIYGVGLITCIDCGGPPIPFPPQPTNPQATINGQDIVLTCSESTFSNYVFLYIYKNNNSSPICTLYAPANTNAIYSYTDKGAAGSLPATYTICASNAGGASNATPITIPSNVISSSTNWSGIVDINTNVTINSGITLIVAPGTNILFSQSASLITNGILNANGTSSQPITFTSTSGTSPGSWGSIILSGSGANGSILSYLNMQYGTEIEALNTSNITIQYSTIQNCTNGIYGSTATGSILYNTIKNVTGSAIMLNASAMDCKYNVIYKTPGFAYYYIGYGLEYFNGSTGTVYQNDIAGMNQGVNVYNRAWISSNGPDDNNKNNRITNCSKGLYVYYMSNAILGTTPNTGGQWNSIYGNGYNVTVGEHSETGSEVYAYGNWWGSYPPNTSLFTVYSLSSFYDYSPLNYDPWRGIPLHLNSVSLTPIIADNKTIDVASTSQSESGQVLQLNSSTSGSSIEPLLDGIVLLNQNRYNDAKNFFLSYLSKHPDNQSAYAALYNCYNKETAPDIIKYFTSLPPQAAKDHKFLLSNLYLKQGNVALAKGVNNIVIHDNPNTALSERGKLNKMYIALDIDNNIDSASTIFTDILNSPNLLTESDISQAQDRIEIYAATRGKAIPNFKMQGGTNNSIPTTISLNNFPNPFNPTTNISYQLIENSRVSIKVYDILGRQVATLVDGNKAAGQYITVFDGSRYSSGIYFVRMMVQGSNSQQFVKTLKIQMLK